MGSSIPSDSLVSITLLGRVTGNKQLFSLGLMTSTTATTTTTSSAALEEEIKKWVERGTRKVERERGNITREGACKAQPFDLRERRRTQGSP